MAQEKRWNEFTESAETGRIERRISPYSAFLGDFGRFAPVSLSG
jgi:hypothetical protein